MGSLRRWLRKAYLIGKRRPLGAMIGPSTMVWGLLLLNPGVETFRNPSYATMAALGPEWSWGATVAGAGALLTYGTWSGNYWARKLGFLLSCAVRTFLMLFVGYGSGWSTQGPYDFFFWAFGSAVGFLETERE